MAENSSIEWTMHTFNPWRGCTKVSDGCKNCYAETLSGRNRKTLGVWGPQGTRVVASESQWKLPPKWDAAAKAAGERQRVFCASLADVFEDWQGQMVNANGERLYHDMAYPGIWRIDHLASSRPPVKMDDVRTRLFDLIDATPNLDWLLLTKRPENIARMMPCPRELEHGIELHGKVICYHCGSGKARPNLWLGTSVENQATADERIPHLLKVPAAVRFLSMEPLLGSVELTAIGHGDQRGLNALTGEFVYYAESGDVRSDWTPAVHWVIVGGESGLGARPMHPDWARSIRDQCQAAGVPFFMKQWGEFLQTHPSELHLSKAPVLEAFPNVMLQRVGKKAAGRLLDGREWNEFPEVNHG